MSRPRLALEHREKIRQAALRNWQRWREAGASPETRPGIRARPQPYLRLVTHRAPSDVMLLWLMEHRLAYLDWRRPWRLRMMRRG